jgi:protein gp37
MADIFDKRGPETERARLWQLVRDTPNLEWLVLTKRPQNICKFVPRDWPLKNVRLGVTTENQDEANRRIRKLLDVSHALPPFLSAEPLLEAVDLSRYLSKIGWVIVGGESGPRARSMDAAWVRALLEQCTTAGVPFFFKQWGGKTPKAGGHLLDGREYRQFPEFNTDEKAGLPNVAYR